MKKKNKRTNTRILYFKEFIAYESLLISQKETVKSIREGALPPWALVTGLSFGTMGEA